MHATGISDSLTATLQRIPACSACGSEARVSGGACLGCLLSGALEPVDESELENFDALLAEVDVRDRDWRLGNYQIFEEIGRGGMGVIYRARQRHSKRVVALKRVLSYHGDSRQTLERFRREAEAAASLDHPNILPIYEVGEADGLPFFTMKYAPGGSLYKAAPAFHGRTSECVALIAKVTRAVSHAHTAGILHRDLKPGNILLDGRSEPLVSDFGLAKWMDGETDFTRSLAVFGTPGYMAPEQAHGQRALVGPPADIYSIGAILFELITGRPPFLGEHALAVIHQAADSPAPKLRSLVATIDRDLETICAKCLERDPQSRYASAAELARDLERWQEGCPIAARPVSAATRMWRWSKRNPLLAGTTALCLLLMPVAATRQISGWQLQKQLETGIATQHAVDVLPLLDLDTLLPAEQFTKDLGIRLESELKQIGPARLRVRSGSSTSTLPAARADAATDESSRAVLSGTVRTVNGQRRVSLHLLDAGNLTPLLHTILHADAAGAELATGELATDIYRRLSAVNLHTAAVISDPGLLDLEAKSFIEHGIDLAQRRGAPNLERSIVCLKHATELQPNSSVAHAALAKSFAYEAAYNATREPVHKAVEHAQRAIDLNPANPDGHLALAAALYHSGRLRDCIN